VTLARVSASAFSFGWERFFRSAQEGAQILIRQVGDEKGQRHQKPEPFYAFFILLVRFGGVKGRIFEKAHTLSITAPCSLSRSKICSGKKGGGRCGQNLGLFLETRGCPCTQERKR